MTENSNPAQPERRIIKPRGDRRKRADHSYMQDQAIQIDLPTGARDLIDRNVIDIYREDDTTYGFTTLFGQTYRVKLMPHIHQWRIVDSAGNYKRIEFEEAMKIHNGRRAYRARRAAKEVASA